MAGITRCKNSGHAGFKRQGVHYFLMPQIMPCQNESALIGFYVAFDEIRIRLLTDEDERRRRMQLLGFSRHRITHLYGL